MVSTRVDSATRRGDSWILETKTGEIPVDLKLDNGYVVLAIRANRVLGLGFFVGFLVLGLSVGAVIAKRKAASD